MLLLAAWIALVDIAFIWFEHTMTVISFHHYDFAIFYRWMAAVKIDASQMIERERMMKEYERIQQKR